MAGSRELLPGETRQSVRFFQINHDLYGEMNWKFRFGDQCYKEYGIRNATNFYETLWKIDLFHEVFFIDGDKNVRSI
jgi:hypothetical protein